MDKNEQVKNLYEGAMSLYNTIDIETNNKENNYKNAEAKVNEILNGEEPLFIPSDDGIATVLFQDVNVGYGLCGLKYIDMILNNKNISSMVLGYSLMLINKLAKENQDLALKLASLDNESGIEESKYEGISE